MFNTRYEISIHTSTRTRISNVKSRRYEPERKSANAKRHIKSITETEARESTGVFRLCSVTGWPRRYLKREYAVFIKNIIYYKSTYTLKFTTMKSFAIWCKNEYEISDRLAQYLQPAYKYNILNNWNYLMWMHNDNFDTQDKNKHFFPLTFLGILSYFKK